MMRGAKVIELINVDSSCHFPVQSIYLKGRVQQIYIFRYMVSPILKKESIVNNFVEHQAVYLHLTQILFWAFNKRLMFGELAL